MSSPGGLPRAGFVEDEVAAEFPGLRLEWLSVEASLRRSPPSIQHRLRQLSNGYRGTSVVAMRTHAVPSAYRTFFRQTGLDPDVVRIPSEEAAVARLVAGGFRSENLVADALLIALIETGVAVWALDADSVDEAGLGIRTTDEGEELGAGAGARPLPPGRLVVADGHVPQAILFGEIAPGHEVSARTSRVVLFAVAVPGVPAIHLGESLWIAADLLS